MKIILKALIHGHNSKLTHKTEIDNLTKNSI